MTHLTRNTTLLFLIRASDLKTKKFFLPRKLLARYIDYKEATNSLAKTKPYETNAFAQLAKGPANGF